MRLEITQGGSGKWIAREISETYSNGRHSFADRKWNGHCPIKYSEDAMTVIARQLRRAIAERPNGDEHTSIRGGHVLGVYNTESGQIKWGG